MYSLYLFISSYLGQMNISSWKEWNLNPKSVKKKNTLKCLQWTWWNWLAIIRNCSLILWVEKIIVIDDLLHVWSIDIYMYNASDYHLRLADQVSYSRSRDSYKEESALLLITIDLDSDWNNLSCCLCFQKSVFINVGRGDIVSENELIQAIR